jgi:hypothetical protein
VTNVLIALDRLLADRPDLFHRAGSPRARPLP